MTGIVFLWQYAQTAVLNRTSLLAVEVDWLKSIKANLVVSALLGVPWAGEGRIGIGTIDKADSFLTY